MWQCLILTEATFIKQSSNHNDQFTLHVHVNLFVTGKGSASIGMTRQRRDKTWILHLLIKVADKGTSCHVCGGYLIDMLLYALVRLWVIDCHNTGNATDGEELLQRFIIGIGYLGDRMFREQSPVRSMVSVEDIYKV